MKTLKGDIYLDSTHSFDMVRRHAATAMIAFTVFLIAFSAAFAQQMQRGNFGPRANQPAPSPGVQQQQPSAEVIATHGDWAVQCSEMQLPPGMAGEGDTETPQMLRQCGMIQGTQSPEREEIGLTLIIARGEPGTEAANDSMMRILVPIGVFLPTGVALEIDGEPVGRVPFLRCAPQVCVAFAETDSEMIDKMKRGRVANFIIYEAPGHGFGLEISLSGFTAAYDELGNM